MIGKPPANGKGGGGFDVTSVAVAKRSGDVRGRRRAGRCTGEASERKESGGRDKQSLEQQRRRRETSLSPAGDISPFRGEGNRPEGAGEGAQGASGKPARKIQSKPRAVKMTITRVDGHTAGYSLLDDDRIHVELHEQTNAFTEEELLTWAAEITQAVEMLGAKN